MLLLDHLELSAVLVNTEEVDQAQRLSGFFTIRSKLASSKVEATSRMEELLIANPGIPMDTAVLVVFRLASLGDSRSNQRKQPTR